MTRYLMTDHHRGAAYVQDVTLTPDGEVEDVVEVEVFDLDVEADDGRAVDAAALRAARAAGYDVAGPAGANNDVGSAFVILTGEAGR